MIRGMLCGLGAIIAMGALGAGSGAGYGGRATDGGTDQEACLGLDASIPLSGHACGQVPPPQVSCYLPPDVYGKLAQPDLNEVQRASDIFSWQEFIALNWPADPRYRGRPDAHAKLSASGPRVWETWKETSEVYLPDGTTPPKWSAPQPIPRACQQAGATKVLFRVQKIDDILDSTTQAAGSDGTLPTTLTDQRGHLVHYEIRMNETLFKYVYDHHLYNGLRQAQATSISMPSGSILVKAAWREVTKEEEPFFETAEACICEAATLADGGSGERCAPHRVGLVGLHITQKTDSAPQWIWSTFEQVGNVRPLADGGWPSFYNPTCPQCPKNRQTRPGTPNQVTRLTPIPSTDPDCKATQRAVDNVRVLDQDVQRALADAGSVLQYYELVNTQWPSSHSDGGTPSTVFTVLPATLANTTMETYVQETSTCMGCHAMARTDDQNAFVSSDFSFTLNDAEPHPDGGLIIPPPRAPKTKWDLAHWSSIRRGNDLAGHTYELLPGYVNAQLHCGSCHLNDGRNPNAAWWVELGQEGYHPAAKLQSRINGCFERSMNGQALCSTAIDAGPGSCNDDPNMQALLDYMKWLDEQWTALDGGTAPHGFPPLDGGTTDAGTPGNPDAGQAIFVQKCAVCHAADGQGRYAHDTYYRPALWGERSFNACAGLAGSRMLAEFAHANMPLNSGGLLTPQEAWDVAAFIDGQCRPGSPTNGPTGCKPMKSPHCQDGGFFDGIGLPPVKEFLRRPAGFKGSPFTTGR